MITEQQLRGNAQHLVDALNNRDWSALQVTISAARRVTPAFNVKGAAYAFLLRREQRQEEVLKGLGAGSRFTHRFGQEFGAILVSRKHLIRYCGCDHLSFKLDDGRARRGDTTQRRRSLFPSRGLGGLSYSSPLRSTTKGVGSTSARLTASFP